MCIRDSFYCVAAKRLLDEKNIRYVEHDVSRDTALREKMLEKANGLRTVPQIFINDVHIGGCDELYEMDRKGSLNDMISNNTNE